MAHRKLQQEVDRVFKKISEGMDSFDESYERHELSNNQTQRDKLENDLKKEIKKLQKLREQIKVWQTQNEVKDKDALLRHRRLVETAMEKYKQVEKESKHKAYSREGLTQPEQLSPEEQEKHDTIEYVKNTLEELQIQLESLEAELARLLAGGRKSKKGGLAPKDQERKSELDDAMEMFKFHQQSLELVLRLLQNGKLEPEVLNELRDDIQYFLENNQEPDFMYDDSIYEVLGLEERDNILVHDVKSSFDGINGDVISKTIEELSEKPSNRSSILHKRNSPAPTSNGNHVSAPLSASKSGVTSSASSITTAASSVLPIGDTSPLPPTATLLKPATVPVRPIGEKKWAVAAATSLIFEDNKEPPASAPAFKTLSQKKHTGTDDQNNAPASAPIDKTVQTISSSLVSPRSQPQQITKHNGQQHQQQQQQQSQPQLQQQQRQQQQPQQFAAQQQQATLGDSIANAPAVEKKHLLQNELDYKNDLVVASIPPGIQSFISSFIESRNKDTLPNGKSGEEAAGKTHAQISCSGDLLSNLRKDSILGINSATLHPTEFSKLNSEWDAIRCQLDYDAEADEIVNQDALLLKVDIIMLFFGFYYGMSLTERKLAQRGLFLKNWRLHNNKIFWFYKLTPASATTEKFEVSNYEVFDAFNWNVKIINNYRLELSQLVSIGF